MSNVGNNRSKFSFRSPPAKGTLDPSNPPGRVRLSLDRVVDRQPYLLDDPLTLWAKCRRTKTRIIRRHVLFVPAIRQIGTQNLLHRNPIGANSG